MTFTETMTAVNLAIGAVVVLSGAYLTVRSRSLRLRVDELDRWVATLRDQKDDCERREARLSGQLEALTSQFLEKLADRITRTTVDAMGEALSRFRAPHRREDPDTEDWR